MDDRTKWRKTKKWRLSWGYWPRDLCLCCTVSNRALWEQPVLEDNNASVMEKHQGVAGSHSQIQNAGAKFGALLSSRSVYCSWKPERTSTPWPLMAPPIEFLLFALCVFCVTVIKRRCSQKCIHSDHNASVWQLNIVSGYIAIEKKNIHYRTRQGNNKNQQYK